MKMLFPWVALLAAMVAPALAQDVSAQKALYNSIEEKLDSYKKLTATTDDGIALKGWKNREGRFVKIVSENNGNTAEFYLGPDNKVAFVFLDWNKNGTHLEDRIYFANKSIVKWLTDGKDADLDPATLNERYHGFVHFCHDYSLVLLGRPPR